VWLATQVANVTQIGNVLKVPGDRRKDEQASWFTEGTDDVGQRMNPLRPGNEVQYLIDGEQAFEEMARVLLTAKSSDDFIYIANWWFDSSVQPLADSTQTLKSMLHDASQDGVMIRAMFWDQIGPQNTVSAKEINALPTGGAILDDRSDEGIPIILVPYHTGCQHQKFMCVRAAGLLTVFVGGVDWNLDRVPRPGTTGDPGDAGGHAGGGLHLGKNKPLHDVHCRIRGPAAFDVVQTFVDRWTDSHRLEKLPPAKQALSSLDLPPEVAAPEGRHFVQIARTFGQYNYRFAPHGERTARELILKAIGNAKRFIYTEDQYFFGNDQLRSALAAAMPRIEHFTAIITPQESLDVPESARHRRDFVQFLRKVGGDKVRIFTLTPAHAEHTYVHAKVWIMDDEFAAISTVNLNRRCFTHDSEIIAGTFEPSSDRVLMYRLAHWLRIKLWAEHLGLRPWRFTPDRSPPAEEQLAYAELSDGVASAVHFQVPPPTARFRAYDEHGPGAEHAPGIFKLLWESLIDPE
jgi:phosphatidylserine/phosphatidylglycerophosphate/cardiolipin synthase-like enzyme